MPPLSLLPLLHRLVEQDLDFEGRPSSPTTISASALTNAGFSDNGSNVERELCHLVVRGVNRMDYEIGAVCVLATFFANPMGNKVSVRTSGFEVRYLQRAWHDVSVMVNTTHRV